MAVLKIILFAISSSPKIINLENLFFRNLLIAFLYIDDFMHLANIITSLNIKPLPLFVGAIG